MPTPVADAAQITLNDPQLAEPLLRILLWAIKPGSRDSLEFEEIIDHLYMKSPEYIAGREAFVKDRAAA